MNWLQKVWRAFAKKKPEEIKKDEPLVLEEPKPEIIEVLEEKVEVDLPYWVKNEDMLRDEGVIYGLSGVSIQEKINSIEAAYKKYAAEDVQSKEELSEKIGELNLKIESINEEIENLKQKMSYASQSVLEDNQWVRVSLGLLLAVGMAAGNYFLIREGVAYGFPQQSDWISWGVFLTGMFNLYASTSFLHSENKISWRSVLEEFGMPLAASLFVLAQVWQPLGAMKALAYFVFVFFIFLLSGKLLLGFVSRLKVEMAKARRNRELLQNKEFAKTDWPRFIQEKIDRIEEIRLKKWKIISVLNDVEANLSRINAEKEAAINLFKSEYELASQYKEKLNAKQLAQILNK